MRLETERLIIRSLERGDERVFAEMAKDGTLVEVGFDANCAEWMDGWISEAETLTANDNPRADYIPCTLVLKATGEVIGSVGSTYYEDTDRVGICYFVGSEHRQKGYVSEAVPVFASFFFEHYGESEILATILDSNEPSWRTAEKCGFELLETKLYRDIYDEQEALYRFYVLRKG